MYGRVPTARAAAVRAALRSLRPPPHAALPLQLRANRHARLAPASALLSTPDTTLLATLAPAAPPAAAAAAAAAPLLVDFRARAAAVGVIPATWTRREQQPALQETLTARLIDRCVRPVLRRPAHITVSVLAARRRPECPVDALAVNAAFAALAALDDWPGPLAAARVARVGPRFVPFPSDADLRAADVSAFVAINADSRLLAAALHTRRSPAPDALAVDALADAVRAAEALLPVHRDFRHALLDLRHREGRSAFPRHVPTAPDPPPPDPVPDHVLRAVYDAAHHIYARAFVECRAWPGKAHRAHVLTRAQRDVLHAFPHVPMHVALDVAQRASRDAHAHVLLRDNLRIDGRAPDHVRPIRAETAVLPGDVHGSALFERGDTQVLACSTFGLKAQAIRTEEYVEGGLQKPFFVHYSFPPYATGDYGRFGGVSSRREIGHSALAEHAIEPVLDVADDDYPYAVRLSADVMASDGSSSMATVCAGSLALLDAGAPLREPVAGVAMGLVANEHGHGDDDAVILTDILGAEDHFGDMDMKVTGTDAGVTACQLDTKREHGLSMQVVRRAFDKAKVARKTILQEMRSGGVDQPRDMPEHAPRVVEIPVNPLVAIQTMMKDRAAGLRDIEARSETRLQFDGQRHTITVEAPNKKAADLAQTLIAAALGDLAVGTKLDATVVDVKKSYAVVEISSGGGSGILHVSKMQVNPSSQGVVGSDNKDDPVVSLRYPDARSLLSLGDPVEVIVLESDRAKNILRFGLVSPPPRKESLEGQINSILEAAKSAGSRM